MYHSHVVVESLFSSEWLLAVLATKWFVLRLFGFMIFKAIDAQRWESAMLAF
jgi:hypothetical protein